jgi:RNA polymerase sigma-70 factor (ECF subfamily)
MKRDSNSNSAADMADLGRLLEEHRSKLLAVVQRRLDPALARRISPEDILSEAFLQARRKFSAFNQQHTMSAYAWLYRIVMDCLIEAWRHETRDRRHPDREMPWPERSSVQLALSLVSPGTTPSEAVDRRILQKCVRGALEMLGSRDREILWMRHYDQLTFSEAATVLGIKESAANLRYVRALRRLKNLWQELYEPSVPQGNHESHE